MQIEIEIDDSQVRTMLQATPHHIAWAIQAAINDATALLLRDVRDYPAQRTGSTYVRTHVLQKSWTRQITGRGLETMGIVGSNPHEAPYNRRVQDAERQATIHHILWGNRTVQAIQRNRTAAINQMFATRLEQSLNH